MKLIEDVKSDDGDVGVYQTWWNGKSDGNVGGVAAKRGIRDSLKVCTTIVTICWTTTHGDVKLVEDGKSDGDVGGVLEKGGQGGEMLLSKQAHGMHHNSISDC
jgi:hypothetical protein